MGIMAFQCIVLCQVWADCNSSGIISGFELTSKAEDLQRCECVIGSFVRLASGVVGILESNVAMSLVARVMNPLLSSLNSLYTEIFLHERGVH